jgi:hypothetical protein
MRNAIAIGFTLDLYTAPLPTVPDLVEARG